MLTLGCNVVLLSAIYLFTVTLIGLGIGPTAVALVTDYVFMDDMDVRYSIFWVASIITLASVILLWMGLKPYRGAARHWSAGAKSRVSWSESGI